MRGWRTRNHRNQIHSNQNQPTRNQPGPHNQPLAARLRRLLPTLLPALLPIPLSIPLLAQSPAGQATPAARPEQPRLVHPGNGPNGHPQTTFLVHRLGMDHAEGISTLDVNGDGWPDLLSGAYWYENPGAAGGEWKRHQYRQVGILNEFVSDSGEWAIDVNHDGRPDVVTTGWMLNGLWWFENPGKVGGLWTEHKIADSYDTEGGTMADINGDGKPDLLTPYGWFRNIDADHDKWEWHPDWNLGDAGFPILGYDVNNDGRMDVIYGQGHSYGLYWLEQQGSGSSRHWVRHVIDESYSQIHALKLADINGDGQPELIAGKRYRGHSGHDPGSYDPLVVYYYTIDRKHGTFTRHAISVNGTAGVGTQILALDLDKDGDIDLATAGKTGVHVFENLTINNVPAATREQELLLDLNWPYIGEGVRVQQEDGPGVE